jgi:hypothetical protein
MVLIVTPGFCEVKNGESARKCHCGTRSDDKIKKQGCDLSFPVSEYK